MFRLFKEKPLKIKIKYFDDACRIEKISVGDWIDLKAAEDVEMKKGDFKLINLGVGMILPDGYEAVMVPRSSTFKKWSIIQTNSMGVIDNAYSGENIETGERDEWKFPAFAEKATKISKGDRICQFRIQKKMNVELVEVDKLNDKVRGGFGSTGTK